MAQVVMSPQIEAQTQSCASLLALPRGRACSHCSTRPLNPRPPPTNPGPYCPCSSFSLSLALPKGTPQRWEGPSDSRVSAFAPHLSLSIETSPLGRAPKRQTLPLP